MVRSLRLSLALIALGLWASLAPQVTFASAFSSQPSSQVLVVWPGWAIQQDLGQMPGAVGHFQIWVSAEPRRGVATVWASLVDASTKEVLRQTTLEATPAYVPVARTLAFPSYVAAEGQQLQLQLQLATFEERSVILALAYPVPGLANVKLNGVPDAGNSPLAYIHEQTGSGLRAAMVGEPSSRIRLILAALFSALLILAHPRFVAKLTIAGVTALGLASRLHGFVRRPRDHGVERYTDHASLRSGRLLSWPWYPWLVAVVPVLHFLVSNPSHFAVHEAVLPIAAVLLAVTAIMVVLWFWFRDWHRSAAATAGVTAMFFAHGHVQRALDYRIDERILVAVAVVISAAIVISTDRRNSVSHFWTRFLNLGVAVLFVFPAMTLAMTTVSSLAPSSTSEQDLVSKRVAKLLPSGLTMFEGRHKPDIYYIILDSYARHDALDGYDNTGFLDQLRSRGFYVATEATSNYPTSIRSIPSSLNMIYINQLELDNEPTDSDLLKAAHWNSLATILKAIGYTYVHMESGIPVTDKAPLADISYRFTAHGTLVENNSDISQQRILSSAFVRALMETTTLGSIVGQGFLSSDDTPYSWWSPIRALQMFDVLSSPIHTTGPKFVFAHILKPHRPAVFDRHGNYLSGNRTHEIGSHVVQLSDEFSDSHDPRVPNAYIGQLIYTNLLVLEAIDAIQRHSDNEAVIVLAGDHGPQDDHPRHEILAAFYLPDGGNSGLYPSISSVNHFRYILDFYFDLHLGLLNDLTF